MSSTFVDGAVCFIVFKYARRHWNLHDSVVFCQYSICPGEELLSNTLIENCVLMNENMYLVYGWSNGK